MKKLALLLLTAAGLSLTACGGDDAEGGKDGADSGVKVSKNMADFIGGFNGSHKGVAAALKKHGATAAIKEDDMGVYDLKSPKVKGQKTSDAGDCYTMDAGAGMTTRTYDVCWKSDKISSIKFVGMK